MRIGTWNLERAIGAAKNARRAAMLAQHDCDVWVLTETSDDIDLSATHHPVRSSPRPSARPREQWATIWSRYPVAETPSVADPRRTTCALLNAPTGPLLLFGTVLPWHRDRGDEPADPPPRNWSEHHRVMAQQDEEWAALRRTYPGAALCVAGDLNTDLGGRHYYGTARGRSLLRAAMAHAGLFCATETSRLSAGTLTYPPIDHVLLPAAWTERTRIAAAWESKAPDGTRLSDHSGLVVEIAEKPSA